MYVSYFASLLKYTCSAVTWKFYRFFCTFKNRWQQLQPPHRHQYDTVSWYLPDFLCNTRFSLSIFSFACFQRPTTSSAITHVYASVEAQIAASPVVLSLGPLLVQLMTHFSYFFQVLFDRILFCLLLFLFFSFLVFLFLSSFPSFVSCISPFSPFPFYSPYSSSSFLSFRSYCFPSITLSFFLDVVR
jgi:hypothetical protein